MKYIKGVNMNFDDKAYLQSHFEEEESGLAQQQIQQQAVNNNNFDDEDNDLAELPDEFKGVKPQMIEQNIRRLEMDMEAEISTIRQRYTDKIDNMKNVLKIAKR